VGDGFEIVTEEGGVLPDEVVLGQEPQAGERAIGARRSPLSWVTAAYDVASRFLMSLETPFRLRAKP
jgi:hypothetical protein